MKKPASSFKESSSEPVSKSITELEVSEDEGEDEDEDVDWDLDWDWDLRDEEGEDTVFEVEVEVEVDSVGLVGEKVEKEGKPVEGIASFIDSFLDSLVSLDSLDSFLDSLFDSLLSSNESLMDLLASFDSLAFADSLSSIERAFALNKGTIVAWVDE